MSGSSTRMWGWGEGEGGRPLSATPEFVNEVTFGKPLRMEADCQGNQPNDKRIATFNPTPPTSRRERLEVALILNDK